MTPVDRIRTAPVSSDRANKQQTMAASPSSTLQEVPYLFPALDVETSVYIVNDKTKTFRRQTEYADNNSNNSSSSNATTTQFADEALLRGAASVSSVSSATAVGAVITTCLLLETPWILSVALSCAGQAPATVQLDLGTEVKSFSTAVSVQAFGVGLGNDALIRLNLVDESGVILSLLLNGITLQPIADSLQVVVIADMLAAGMEDYVAEASLQSCMICHLSPTRIILSLNPFILAVDLEQETTAVWSKTECLQVMDDNHANPFTKYLSKGVGYVLGQQPNVLVDMNPTSAVCVAANDASTVFTLHSDGIVRRWKVSSESLAPVQVFEVAIPSSLPDCETWSDANHSTFLCARLYRGNYVLAIYILTNGNSDVTLLDDDNNNNDDETIEATAAASDCYLAVVHGSIHVYDGSSSDVPLALQVPCTATSLVGMSFDPSLDRCSLVAFFQAVDLHADAIGSIHATYPPSNVSIVGTQPDIAPCEYFLESVAVTEKARIAALSFYDVLQESLSMEEVLHQVDSFFLKYLFRPAVPRGTGTVLPPSPAHIRRALQKLIKYTRSETAPCSVELDTLRGIHEWRAKESRKIVSMTPVKQQSRSAVVALGTDMAVRQGGGAMSIYDSLVAAAEEEDEDDDAAVFKYVDGDDIDRDMESQVKAHEGRWRRLLLEIWTEEQTDRLALCLAMPETTRDTAVLVRLGATSIITKTIPSEKKNQLIASVDDIALKIVRGIEDDSTSSLELVSVERKVWQVLSKGQTALNPSCIIPLQEQLALLGRDALYEAISPQESKAIEDILRTMDEKELIAALQTVPFGSELPGLCALNGVRDGIATHVSRQNAVADSHLRLAASSLSIRSADSTRRLFLGRFLVFSELSGRRDAVSATLLMYLHSVTVSWVFAQHVGMPLTTAPIGSLVPAVRFHLSGESPPTKRLSFGNGASSILAVIGTRDTTIALDELLISLSQKIKFDSTTASLVGATCLLAGAAFGASFQFAANALGEKFSFTQLPELGVLAASSGDGIAHPKLALRLLAPFITLQNPNESTKVVTAREELLSRCLVMSSRTETAEVAADMVQRACQLLKFDELDVDNIMRRLNILDSHIGEDTRLSGMLLEFIQSAINQMDIHFPEEMRNSMPEYISLWSTLFNTAIAAHQWEKAYVAALNNPELERRTDSFKRLVRAMVDAGALTELIQKCASFSNESTADAHSEVFRKGVDMYAIAAETLAQASVRDLYLFRAINPEEPLSDYQGALYALHVSQGQWRRAAQALDLRYSNAIKALASGPDGSQLDHTKTLLRESLIIDDLVLAAVGCRNAVGLVRDVESKFIVSGEHGPHPLTLSKPSQGASTGTKRGRILGRHVDDEVEKEESGSRLDRFMNLSDLEMRAARSEALRALFHDESTDPSFAKSMFCSKETSNDTDRTIMDELFARGYYQHGLVLANIMSKAQGSSPDGRGIFHDSLSHMLCTYLVPLSVDRSFVPTRPTLAQLQAALGSLGDSEASPLLVGDRSKKLSALARSNIRLGATALLQSLTKSFTTAENPVAVEVAETLLEVQGNIVPLPPWLEQILLYGTSTDQDAPGLFARRSQKDSRTYLGDPSALLSLYTKRGMYQPAFSAIAAVLLAQDENKAPSRLPEKGNIDFVPYDKIDILWNLSEIALRRGDFDKDEEHQLLESRRLFEQSLEKHFALLTISEEGQTSARALA